MGNDGGGSMSWSVSRSWQAPHLISTACNVGNELLVSCGLDLILLDEETNQRWKRSLPFRVHSAAHDSGKIGALCGHGFHLLRVSDGTQLNYFSFFNNAIKNPSDPLLTFSKLKLK